MIAVSRKIFGLVFLMVCMAAPTPGHAQSDAQPSPMITNGNGGGGIDDEHSGFQRQDISEERAQIRKEHEDLEAARDKLRDQCANAQGPQIQTCEEERDALRERHEKLHERVQALRAKMEQLHQEHGGDPGSEHAPPSASNNAANARAQQP